MSMELPLEIKIPLDGGQQSLWLHSAVTYLIGENGSGKSQLLRSLKSQLEPESHIFTGKKLKLLSAGRTGNHEGFRAIDYVNYRTNRIQYDAANFGGVRDYAELMQDEMLSGVLQNLSARVDLQVKIQECLRKIFCRRVHFNWDHGQLKVYFSSIQSSEKYISSKEASGLMHLVVLLAVIYDDKIGLALLDEPEVSLHPQMQLFILKEIVRTSGVPQEGTNKKLYIIATHSAHMLHIAKTEDILSLVACCGYNKKILQVGKSQGELQNAGVQRMIAHFGLEYKSALFSKRPLLVEGQSDIIICNALAKRYDLPVEAAGGQLLSMTGKGQIPAVVKLFKILGKQPLVLADADAIADDSTLANFVAMNFTEFSSIANKDGGHASAQEFIRNIYNKFGNLVENKWHNIERLATLHRYFKLFCREGSNRVKR